jgi:hypothetical protein
MKVPRALVYYGRWSMSCIGRPGPDASILRVLTSGSVPDASASAHAQRQEASPKPASMPAFRTRTLRAVLLGPGVAALVFLVGPPLKGR